MDQGEPIEQDELLYRRFPLAASWYDGINLSAEAFGPHRENDTSGLSVWRANYKSIEDAARGTGKYGFFIAVLRAGDLFTRQIKIVPKPYENEPGHAELPEITSYNRKEKSTLELKEKLKDLVLRVEGPYHVIESWPPGR